MKKLFATAALLILLLCTLYLINAHGREAKESISRCAYSGVAGEESADYVDGELRRLLEDFYSILPNTAPTDQSQLKDAFGIEAFMEDVLGALSEDDLSRAGSFFLYVVTVAILILLLETVSPEGDLGITASAAAYGILSLPLFAKLWPLFAEVAASLKTSSDFFSELLPLAVGVASAGGAPGTGAAVSGGFGFALAFVGEFICGGLLPLSAMIFLLTLAQSVDNTGIRSISGGIKRCFALGLGAATVLITGIFAIQTAVASSADTLAMRGVKYAVSNMVPVVGGVISGSLSTLNAGVGYAVSVMGGASVYVLLSILVLPFLRLLLCRLALGVGVSLMELLSVAGGKRIFASFAAALDTLIAVLATSGIVYVLETVIFMKQGAVLI